MPSGAGGLTGRVVLDPVWDRPGIRSFRFVSNRQGSGQREREKIDSGIFVNGVRRLSRCGRSEEDMETSKDPTKQFLDRVQSRGGWKSSEAARAAVRHSLRVVGEGLDERTRSFVAEALPAPLRDDLHADGANEAPRDSDDIFAGVASYERVPLGRALEHAQAVLQVTGETIGDERRARIRAVLGEDIGLLFEPRAEPPTPRPKNRATGRTLATGRPGAQAPLSTSDPSPRRTVASSHGPSTSPLSRADPSHPHDDTVASENPHGDRKLATATPSAERND